MHHFILALNVTKLANFVAKIQCSSRILIKLAFFLVVNQVVTCGYPDIRLKFFQRTLLLITNKNITKFQGIGKFESLHQCRSEGNLSVRQCDSTL